MRTQRTYVYTISKNSPASHENMFKPILLLVDSVVTLTVKHKNLLLELQSPRIIGKTTKTNQVQSYFRQENYSRER
jgi:hypothetical protein